MVSQIRIDLLSKQVATPWENYLLSELGFLILKQEETGLGDLQIFSSTLTLCDSLG